MERLRLDPTGNNMGFPTSQEVHFMRKKAPKGKPKSADSLLKTSKKRDIGLTEKELGKVTSGGATRAGTKPYLKVSFDEL
jgi:hypothetical protein